MNDVQPRIPIFRTVASAYGRGIGALLGDGALFRYFVYALLLGFAAFAARIYLVFVYPWYKWALPQGGADIAVGVATLLIYTALMLAIAPFGVAVHRKILLDEAPQDFYLMAMGGRRQRRFFLASIAVLATVILAISIVPAAIYLLYGVNPLIYLVRASTAHPTFGLAIVAAELLGYSIVALAAARSTFAFPAIAVDRPGASLRQSFVETRGTAWRLFVVFVLIYLPPVTIYGIASGVVFTRAVRQAAGAVASSGGSIAAVYLSPPAIAVYAMMVILAISMVAVTAAAAALCYEMRVGHGAKRVADVFS